MLNRCVKIMQVAHFFEQRLLSLVWGFSSKRTWWVIVKVVYNSTPYSMETRAWFLDQDKNVWTCLLAENTLLIYRWCLLEQHIDAFWIGLVYVNVAIICFVHIYYCRLIILLLLNLWDNQIHCTCIILWHASFEYCCCFAPGKVSIDCGLLTHPGTTL